MISIKLVLLVLIPTTLAICLVFRPLNSRQYTQHPKLRESLKQEAVEFIVRQLVQLGYVQSNWAAVRA